MTRPSLSRLLFLFFAFAALAHGSASNALASPDGASRAVSQSPAGLATGAIVVDTAVGFRLALPGNVERVIDGGAALIFIYPDARSVTLVSTFENDLTGWFEGKDTSLAEFVRMVFDPSTPVDIPLGDVAQEMRDALLHGDTRVLRYSAGPVEIHRLMFTEDPTRGLRERAFVTSDTVPHAQLEISAEGVSTKEFEEILYSLGTWN